jgi:hypothetical protein
VIGISAGVSVCDHRRWGQVAVHGINAIIIRIHCKRSQSNMARQELNLSNRLIYSKLWLA